MKKRHYLSNPDIERIRHLIEVEHVQQGKVAEMIGVHLGTIEKLVRRLGLQTQRTGPRSGDGHTNWSGGRIVRKGYHYRYAPNHPNAVFGGRYVAEHRLVMEEKLGRYLLRGEVVHHVDGNPGNNDPANLMIFGSNKQHLKHELTGCVPNWTPEGRQRTLDGVEKWREDRRAIRRSGIRQSTKTSVDQPPPTTDRLPSQSDSTDADPASLLEPMPTEFPFSFRSTNRPRTVEPHRKVSR